jgi:hypothetical protein
VPPPRILIDAENLAVAQQVDREVVGLREIGANEQRRCLECPQGDVRELFVRRAGVCEVHRHRTGGQSAGATTLAAEGSADVSNVYEATVPRHGVALVKIGRPQNRTTPPK